MKINLDAFLPGKLAKWVMENDSRLMNIQVKSKSDRKNWRN
jgi:hypothetical protein